MKQKVLQFLVVVAIIASAFGVVHQAHADANDNVSGYGWSSTIGWISLNCTDPNTCASVNYGVRVDTTTQNLNSGSMSGDAWSPNIGWVSFNASDTASRCPNTAPAHIDLSTGVVTGWARALAGTSTSGWDGCISLSGNGYGLTMDPATGALTGFAWGSSVVGWVSFNGIVSLSPNQPVLSLTASQTQLQSSGPVTLTWASVNVQPSSCTAPWTTQTDANGTQPGVQVSQTTTFTIACTANNGPITASVTVTVASSQSSSLVLQANPMAVQSNNAVTDLSWTSPDHTNFTSCTISSSPTTTTWSGTLRLAEIPNTANGYTHSRQNVAVPSGANQSTTYTITCTDTSNVSSQQASATAIVSVFPPAPAVSLVASPASLPQTGGSSTLEWIANNVNTCDATANPSGWSGAKSPSGGTESVALTTTTMFTITCQSSYSPPQVMAQTTVYVAGSPLCSTCVLQSPPKPKFEEF